MSMTLETRLARFYRNKSVIFFSPEYETRFDAHVSCVNIGDHMKHQDGFVGLAIYVRESQVRNVFSH